MAKRFITIIKDVDGNPRAWGSAPTREAADQEAERQWAKRVAERTADGTLDRSEERGDTARTWEGYDRGQSVEYFRDGAWHPGWYQREDNGVHIVSPLQGELVRINAPGQWMCLCGEAFGNNLQADIHIGPGPFPLTGSRAGPILLG